ncbi:MAG: hypothetical protein CTY30_08055 [Methylocystis sp.]|nr:MAG: hypothetical protein CTY30_08055 [Methylocystis sp.]
MSLDNICDEHEGSPQTLVLQLQDETTLRLKRANERAAAHGAAHGIRPARGGGHQICKWREIRLIDSPIADREPSD